MNRFWSFALEREGIDAYIIKTYPPEHSLFEGYQALRNRWLERYTHTRARRDGFIAQKGFLSIQFKKDAN